MATCSKHGGSGSFVRAVTHLPGQDKQKNLGTNPGWGTDKLSVLTTTSTVLLAGQKGMKGGCGKEVEFPSEFV